MAYIPRTIEQIQAQIIAAKNADAKLAGLTSPSRVAFWRLWIYIQSVAMSFLEQIWALLQTDVELTATLTPPETMQWIQNRVLKFQYNASIPQVVQLNADFSVGYPTINSAYQIITNCAVIPDGSGGIIVKVAKGGTSPTPLSGGEVSALTSYLQSIIGADITFTIVNANADNIDIYGIIYYNGQYNGSIVTDVTNAITNYISTLPFNGIIKLSDLSRVVRNTTGVTDLEFTNVVASAYGGSPINLIYNSTEQSREYSTNAGYITIGTALTTSLTFNIDNN